MQWHKHFFFFKAITDCKFYRVVKKQVVISFRNWTEKTSCLLFFTYSLNHILGSLLFSIISDKPLTQTEARSRTPLGGNCKSKELGAHIQWPSNGLQCMFFQWHQTFKTPKTSFSEILKHTSNIKQEYSHTLKFLTELGPELDSCKSSCKLQK